MDEVETMEGHLSSAAAFVEGGIQDACDEACSICLDAFCDSDPSTVTTCKHGYHLQCILEWCQRSSHCPMCWQPINLKDPTSQDLLETVESERNFKLNQTRSAAIFHHPALADSGLQHVLPDAVLQEHLTATAASGRTDIRTRRDRQLDRSGAHGRQQSLVFPPHPNAPNINSVSASSAQRGEDKSTPSIVASSQSTLSIRSESPNREAHTIPVQAYHCPLVKSGTNGTTSRATVSVSRITATQTPVGQDRAGPSDFQSFSENLKSRINAVSMRYKESITKSARGWRERLFSRNSSVSNICSEVRKEINAGMSTVSHMVERLETRERITSITYGSDVRSSTVGVAGNRDGHSNDNSTLTSFVATSGPN